MTDATIAAIVTALCAALPPTLVALAGLRQGRRNGRKADAGNAVAAKTATKVEGVARKADEIHDLTNSAFAALKGELVAATTRVAILEREKIELVATIAALSGKERRN